MSALAIQRLLALVFLTLGSWALLFPRMVESVVFVPVHQIDTMVSALLIGCFGAQACLCGIVVGLSQFRRITFIFFGVAGSIPFIVLNYYFLFVEPIFTNWLVLDFAGNLAIAGLCILGYRSQRSF